jgi:hypothetical protein
MRGIFIASLALLAPVVGACTKEHGVGEPCIPEPVPCDEHGNNCGFQLEETYLQTDSPACAARACVVRKLDNGTNGETPADPRVVCEEQSSEGCVSRANLERSTYCTCRCGGPKAGAEHCECPEGFVCTELLTVGAAEFRGSYCVRPR